MFVAKGGYYGELAASRPYEARTPEGSAERVPLAVLPWEAFLHSRMDSRESYIQLHLIKFHENLVSVNGQVGLGTHIRMSPTLMSLDRMAWHAKI